MAEEYTLSPSPSPPPSPPSHAITGRPMITEIVAGIGTVFAITFIVLVYVQHCKTGGFGANSRDTLPLSRVDSGVNRKVIEQLPLFRFSSLRGQKDGLDCSVCLARFEAEEVLRLLPKCRHAFHVDCVDTWLDQHSTCPLCRYRVRSEDILLIDCQGSRHKALYNYGETPNRHSSAGERARRGDTSGSGPRRRSFENRTSRRRRSGTLSANTSRTDHRLEHQIVVSDGGEAHSDVTKEEEVFYLRTEMLLGDGTAEEEEEEEEISGNGRAFIDDKSATGTMKKKKNRRRSRSDVGERKGREIEEERIAKKMFDRIPQPKPAPNSASSSSFG